MVQGSQEGESSLLLSQQYYNQQCLHSRPNTRTCNKTGETSRKPIQYKFSTASSRRVLQSASRLALVVVDPQSISISATQSVVAPDVGVPAGVPTGIRMMHRWCYRYHRGFLSLVVNSTLSNSSAVPHILAITGLMMVSDPCQSSFGVT
jgi:hypothetical protein